MRAHPCQASSVAHATHLGKEDGEHEGHDELQRARRLHHHHLQGWEKGATVRTIVHMEPGRSRLLEEGKLVWLELPDGPTWVYENIYAHPMAHMHGLPLG